MIRLSEDDLVVLTAHFESGEQRSRRHKIETFNEIDIISQPPRGLALGLVDDEQGEFPVLVGLGLRF